MVENIPEKIDGREGAKVSSSRQTVVSAYNSKVKKSVARDSASTGLPKLDAMFFFGVFRKHWRWMIPVGMLLSLLGIVGILAYFKPTYEARFRLEVDPSNYIVFNENSSKSTPEFVELQKAIMFSNSVLEKVVADKTVAAVPSIARSRDPVQALKKEVKVTSAAGNRLVDVKFQDADPKVAASVVNTLVDEFLRSRRSIEQIRTSSQERNVSAALNKAETEVESAKQRVRDLSMQSVKSDTILGESDSGKIDTTYLDNIRIQRMEIASQLSILQLNLAELKSAYDRDLDTQNAEKLQSKATTISEEVLEKDIVVLTAKQQYEVAKLQLKDLDANTSIGLKNPIYVQAKRKVDFLQEELRRIRESRTKELLDRGNLSSTDERRDRIAQLTSEISQLRTKRDVLESQVKDYLVSLKQSSATSVDLQFAEADLVEWNNIRGTVHERRIRLQTERDAIDDVRELERAITPKLPVEELPYMQLAGASLLGLAIPFLLGLLLELRSRKVDDANQLETRSQLSVLGEISTIPVATTGNLTKKRRSHARELRLFEESVDSLSTTLTLRDDLKNCRVFTVTSALSGEGKTSVSCQLVVSLARSTSSKVLLIDGDLRAPDVHHVFGREMTSGLVGYLNGTDEWRDLIDREWNESIHILTSGHLKGSPHRILSNGRFEKLIEEAREEYDYIVIDTPPVLPASEALLFAKCADAVLMCALRDKSRIEQLIQAYHRLDSSGANVVGSVLSGVPVKEYASYYGDYYASKV
jgi:capsular exopolysaccharide synthesis family protein